MGSRMLGRTAARSAPIFGVRRRTQRFSRQRKSQEVWTLAQGGLACASELDWTAPRCEKLWRWEPSWAPRVLGPCTCGGLRWRQAPQEVATHHEGSPVASLAREIPRPPSSVFSKCSWARNRQERFAFAGSTHPGGPTTCVLESPWALHLRGISRWQSRTALFWLQIDLGMDVVLPVLLPAALAAQLGLLANAQPEGTGFQIQVGTTSAP